MMKLVYLGIILGAILLTGTIGASYASTNSGVKILAKEKQGMILLLVKNGGSVNLYSIKLTLLDGEINSVKTSQGWTVKKNPSDSKTITVTTDKMPIQAHDQAFFSLVTNKINTIISWSAIDRSGLIVDTGSTRTIVKQTLDKVTPAETQTYISNARSLMVTTDKIFYNKGDKMIISGVLGQNSNVLVTIYAPNGQKIKIMDTTDPTGNFKVLHVLHDAPSGTYRLKVSQPSGYAETTFKVL